MIYLNGKKVDFIEFPNKERRLDLPEDMLTVIDYTSVTTQIDSSVNKVYWKYENDASIFELLLFDDAINSYDRFYDLYIGYMPYSRMDRVQEKGTAFSLEILTTILRDSLKSLDYMFILDPHSEVTLQQFPKRYTNKYRNHYNWVHEFKHISNIDNDNKYEFAKDVINYTKLDINKAWFVFPDKGAAKRYNADDYPNVIICEKVRDFATGKIQQIKAHIEKQTTTPEKNAPIIIIDDLCSYGGTFVGAINAIENDLKIKSKNNWLIVTHAEEAMMEANVPNTFGKVFSTDSIATPPEAISMSSQEFDENHQFYVRPVLDIIEELNK